MKKGFLFVGLLLFSACFAYAQQGLPVLVTSTTSGKIYEINVSDCSGRFICTTGKDFNDIAFTPDGKLWGRTIDSLFQIDTTTGNAISIGRAPQGNALVGLNDSTLLIDSLHYLFSIKTTNAALQLIGDMGIGHNAEGDFTWVDKYLYVAAYNAIGNLIRITLDSTYHQIQAVDTIVDLSNPYNEGVTIALASIEADSVASLIAFIGNSNYYKINAETGSYGLLCSGTIVSTSGAASTLFPPYFQSPSSVGTPPFEKIETNIYPNPLHSQFYIILNKDLQYKIVITDITGKALITKNGTGRKTKIDAACLANGMYFIQFKDKHNNIIGVSKIIKR